MNAVTQLASELAAWVKAGLPIVTAGVQRERVSKCEPCEHYNKPGAGRCELCGCFMVAKTWLGSASCPVGKWLPDTSAVPLGVWFFERASARAELAAELESWRGTRFSPAVGGGALRGLSADCVSFVAAVLFNVGAIKAFEWPDYVTHGGGVEMLDLVVKTLDSIPELSRIGDTLPGDLMPGDIILRSQGEAGHHLAIYAGQNTVWHSLRRGGVQTGNIHDPLLKQHVKAVYRVKA